MNFFADKTQFQKRIETDGFTCSEMQDGRPWSYQTDIFCIAGTIHVMLFGDYMQTNKKFGQWDIKSKLPRYLKKHIWSDLFTQFLNIKDIDHLPSLTEFKERIDDELYNMESELQAQIRTLKNILLGR
ncbi:Mitotic checkpoint serine/threonine-protein kinase BUB1, partial [Pseudolycoriella hygida]